MYKKPYKLHLRIKKSYLHNQLNPLVSMQLLEQTNDGGKSLFQMRPRMPHPSQSFHSF